MSQTEPFEHLPPGPVLEAGSTIGPYRLVELLGQGGFGSVYRAFDDRLGREVALKLIRSEARSPVARARFLREARAVARLEHPAICTVFDHGEIDGQLYLVMQLVRGRSLRDRITRAREGAEALLPGCDAGGAAPWLPTRADIDRIAAVFERVARGLHHAHQRGLVHRDVKPANIMIDDAGAPTVLDFGLVRDDTAADRELTLSGYALGSPHYMAPEQVLEEPIDQRTDVYAIGVSLFEALTLRVPFEVPTWALLQKRIVEGNAPRVRSLNRDVPRDLQTVVEIAMDRDSKRRYASAEGLAEDLRRVRCREPILARPASPALRVRRWVQRNPVVATFLVLVSLGFAASTAEYLRAERNLDRFHLLSLTEWLDVAKREADELYPAWPEHEPALRTWIARRVAPLQAELPRLRDALRAMDDPSETSDTDALTFDRSEAGFGASASRFLSSTLRRCEPQLTEFLEADTGAVADVHRRVAWAERTGQVAAAQLSEWQAAIDAIRRSDDVTASALYRGLTIEPQVDLVPLAMDPESKLWEFLHLPSAADPERRPKRDPGTGRFEIDGDDGIVFVLLPAGEFLMGRAQPSPEHRAAAPVTEVFSEPDEGPPATVGLVAFFMAKYETTQGQWRRLMRGDVPSEYGPGHPQLTGLGKSPTWANPVETVSWRAVAELARRQGLALPTEAQWEYACRATTTTVFSFGDDPSGLQHRANVPDLETKEHMADAPMFFPWADPYIVHAPVGRFLPNRFGLHDMHGNVAEWCRDWKVAYDIAPQGGDGYREPADGDAPAFRCMRGGHYQSSDNKNACSDRDIGAPDLVVNVCGCRFARMMLSRQ